MARKVTVLLFAALAWLALAGCSAGTNRTHEIVSAVTAEPPSVWHAYARPFQGSTLRGITEDTPSSRYIRDVLGPQFAAETGIDIEITITDNSVIEEIIAQGQPGYDFVYVEQDVIYGYLEDDRLVNLSAMWADHPELVVEAFDPADFIDFADEFRDPATGALYGVPIEAFIKTYVYRKDLFEDPSIRAAFETEYSYPLSPAVTFQQYRDIADFFTRYGQEHGLDLWGSTVQGIVGHTASFYEFFETIAPAFGVYDWGINLETGRATAANGGALDSAQAKAALNFWLAMLEYAPPEARESTWNHVEDAFGAGRVAQGWLYGEYIAALGTDPARSTVVGKLGVALPPTAPGVVEDAIVGAGYLGYYDGAAFGIPAVSEQQEAALLWLQYLGQPAIQPPWAVETSRIVHLSTFDDPLVQAQDRRLNGYYSLMKQQGHLFAGAPPMADHVEIRDTIAPFIHRAILGELTAEEALDEAARAVDRRLLELARAN